MSDRSKNVKRVQYAISIIAIIVAITHVIWPSISIDSATLFLLAVAIVPWLITIFKSLELPGGWKIEFREYENLDAYAKVTAEKAIEQTASSTQTAISWDKVATLFWLGNDLMWIQDMTYRAAPAERILQGVEVAMLYVKDLGFEEKSFPVRNLSLTKMILEPLVSLSPTNEQAKLVLEGHYKTARQYIQTAKWYIDSLAKTKQPDFKKLRVL